MRLEQILPAPELSREQRGLLHQIHQLVAAGHFKPYITAEAITAQMGTGTLRRNPQMVEGHLAVLAARGLIIPVSREEQTPDTGEYVFGNAWRLPHADQEILLGDGGGGIVTAGTGDGKQAGIIVDRKPGDSIRLRELERLAAQLEKERSLP